MSSHYPMSIPLSYRRGGSSTITIEDVRKQEEQRLKLIEDRNNKIDIILNKNIYENYKIYLMNKPAILFITHEKSIYRLPKQLYMLEHNRDRFIYYFFIGDPNLTLEYKLDEDNKTVYVKCDDNYESLSHKVYQSFKFMNTLNIAGVFKTDDDIEIDLDKLYNTFLRMGHYDYFGYSLKCEEFDSNYHMGKCESEILNKTSIKVPAVDYCSGGGYYIKKDNLYFMIKEKDIYYNMLYEDVSTGLVMEKYNIKPQHIDIKQNGLNWETLSISKTDVNEYIKKVLINGLNNNSILAMNDIKEYINKNWH